MKILLLCTGNSCRSQMGFEDPAATTGKLEDIMADFRRIRDEIREQFYEFYQSKIKGGLQ